MTSLLDDAGNRLIEKTPSRSDFFRLKDSALLVVTSLHRRGPLPFRASGSKFMLDTMGPETVVIGPFRSVDALVRRGFVIIKGGTLYPMSVDEIFEAPRYLELGA